jgi:hypothetical protein
VRGKYPPQSLIDNGDGTVSDGSTGLMWQQSAPTAMMTWQAALDYCGTLPPGKYSDWRVPNIKELGSIVDDTRLNPTIDTTFFPINSGYGFFWSSTTFPVAYLPSHAWGILFGDNVKFLESGAPAQWTIVNMGDPIAQVGNGTWEKCTKKGCTLVQGVWPAHLHFEIREGDSTDTAGTGYTNCKNADDNSAKCIMDPGPQGQIDPNDFISRHR